jgi:hypothetical protein
MSVDDASRRLLHERAAVAFGPEAAAVLMDHLPPAGWSDLARRGDVEHETALLRGELAALGAELRGEMAALGGELRGEMAALGAELRGEMAALRTELRGEMAALRTELRGEMAGLRTELGADLSAAVAAQTRWMVTVLTVLGALFTTATILTG